jgi:hypothetical protein
MYQGWKTHSRGGEISRLDLGDLVRLVSYPKYIQVPIREREREKQSIY